MKRIFLSVFCFLSFFWPLASQVSQADDFNRRGLEQYRQGDFISASELFVMALEEDPGHKWANFNQACMLALFIEHGIEQLDQWDMEDRIYTHLQRAIAVDPSIRQRALADSDFNSIRDHDIFRFLCQDPGFESSGYTTLTFTGTDSLEFDNRVHFEDPAGNYYSVFAFEVPQELGLYFIDGATEEFYTISTNPEMIGSSFDVRWEYRLISSDWSGLQVLYTSIDFVK